MTCQEKSSERGSALLIIVGVLAVLTVAGLAYSARSISTVKQTAQSTQSDQAYACAEAGAEEALGRLEAGEDVSGCTKDSPCSGELKSPQDSTKTLCSFAYSVEADPAADAKSYSFFLEQDLTAQINLAGFSSGSLNWYNEDLQEPASCPDRAALLATVVYYQGSYQMTKEIRDPCQVDRPTTGFASISGGGVDGYTYGYTLSVPDHDANKPVFLRLRALYTGTHAMIKVDDGVLPEQGKRILSTGRAGEATASQVSIRQVEVKRANPALPTVFDYVLFSGSMSSPLPQP